MASPETTLISKLETSTTSTSSIFPLFSDYLRPFSDLIKSTKPPTQTQLRLLAKQFLPFLNRCLSLLPKRLSGNQNAEASQQLFEVYRLCLDCLELVSSQLSCKPYTVYYQRTSLLHCLEVSYLYREAVDEGFRLLERLRGIEFGEEKKTKRKKKLLVPLVSESGGDPEFARLVVEVGVVIVKCVALEQSREDREYRRVKLLLEELNPWFRVVDANAYEKLCRVLVAYLGKCTTFLVGELTNFDGELVRSFCVMTLDEHVRSSLADQVYKFARKICSSLFLLHNDGQLIIDMLTCVVGFLANRCKVDMENCGIKFVDIISYCAIKCRSTSADLSNAFSGYLSDLASELCLVNLPLDGIVRLYAVGLSLNNSAVMSEIRGVTSSKVVNDQPMVNDSILVQLLDSLECHFSCGKDVCQICCSTSQSCSRSCPHPAASFTCMDNNKKSYLLSYFESLKFLCQPLADMVNAEKYQIATKNESIAVSSKLCSILEAFHQLCSISLLLKSTLSEMVEGGFDENKLILSVAVASFVLSTGLKLRLKKSVHLLKHIVGSAWIQHHDLKYLFANLYNIAVSLYKNKQMNEASKALILCCRASWVCVTLHCQRPMDKLNESCAAHSEISIQDLIDEACKGTAFLLDVLHQCGDSKLQKIVLNTLESWSNAKDLFGRLPFPRPLIKHWVKIECKLGKTMDTEDGAPTLYSLLSSSGKLSKKTIGRILEQELLAYEEIDLIFSDYSRRMQTKIIDILLQDFYVMQDSYLQRSRIILKKALVLRALGSEVLYDCIQCVSEAISLMNGSSHLESPICHQLAVAYSLRALYIHEAEPNSKQFFQDIKEAINLWSSIPVDDYSFIDEEIFISLDRALLLLYNIIDLLSLKGSMELHGDICKLMIRWFKHMNIPLEKFLSMMWEGRRFSHGLCMSPLNDALVASFSGELGEECKFVDFWIQCLKESPASLLGFQHSLSFLFGNVYCSSYELSTASQWNITIDAVKQAATELISNVPVGIPSISLAGYLYYDMSEKLVASGKMYEALSYAKEAHRLRLKLFQKKFMYSIEHQVEKTTDAEGHTEKTTSGIQNLQVRTSIATEIQSFVATSSNSMDTCHLSSWKVLQCYLESALQVGIIHEIIGNGVEAETILLWGKRIASAQSLLPFIVAFSSILGKLYCNKQSWDLAEKELKSAKQILVNNCSALPCLKCRLMLEASVNQYLGDLYRSQISTCTADGSAEKKSIAESCYRSAIDKLNDAVWKHGASGPAKVEDVGNDECFCTITKPSHTNFISKMPRPIEKVETKKCRKTKSEMRSTSSEQLFTSRTSRRATRSKHFAFENQNTNILEEVQSGLLQHQKDSDESDFSMSCIGNESVLDERSSGVDLQCEFTRTCSKTKCWSCIGRDIMKSGLLSSFIHLKWEFVRRQVLLRVLSGIGNYLEANGQIHEAHESILQSMSVLVSQNPSSQTSCHIPVTSLLDFLGKEIPGDVFAIERAAVFYNICWFSFKSSTPEISRNICCDLFHVPLSQVVPWLMLAFILAHEVPMLFQKVSRLLSSIFLLSSMNELFTLPSYSKKLSNSQWASYFHQSSLGTHLNHHLYSNIAEKRKSKHLLPEQGSKDTGSMCLDVDACSFPRLAPDSVQDLEQYVINFFSKLPITTVVCISLMDGCYASLLRELLLYSGPVHAWMLLSRFNCISQPVMLLLPVQSVLEDDEDSNSGPDACSRNDDSGKHWHCPWGLTLVDDVAPAFKFILEQNYLSSSTSHLEDTKISRTLWWNRRKKLDCRLHNLLRSLEELWFGPWSIILLGEPSNGKNLDSVTKKLARNLKSKCKIDVNQSLLKILLGSAKNATEYESCISLLFSIKKGCTNGCIIGEDAYQGEETSQKIFKNSNLSDQECALAVQLFCEAQSELEADNTVTRDPVILVLDFEVQMLPWESLPTLRNQEVYRMPSVACISSTLDRNCQHQEPVKTVDAAFPFIDPLDAFYLLNPSGDLTSTQVEFENWFADKKLEGKAGSAPSAQELASALRSHDLFIYFGHGSGAQYISEQEVRKLENCGGTLLMGCSSGSLSLNGCYVPEGAPLSFLQAGSPIIVANLWEVTDKDIDRFGKSMLEAWLDERSRALESCSQCDQLAKGFEAMNIKGGKANAKRKAPKKKVIDDCKEGYSKDHCGHVSRLGSFMGQAREACTLRYLIGASPVCYGVPTGIRRKKDL